jgi:competence protein ComEC
LLVRILAFGLFFCGYGIAITNDIRSNHHWYGNEPTQHKYCLVQLTDDPVAREHTWKVPVTVLAYMDTGRTDATNGKASLYIYKDSVAPKWHKGDTIMVPGAWQTIKNAGNPFEFDYAAWCRRNNIYFQQFCALDDTRFYGVHNPNSTPLIEKIHQWCMAQLDRYLPDQKTKGLVQAMLLGDEVNLNEDLLQSYSETGIVHIIAISGGNVAIFFIFISFLLGWLKHKRHLWIKYAIALPLVWIYVLIAGSSPSAIRAAVMFSLIAGGIMLNKNGNSLNHLFATAFLLLVAQPMWLFSVGFQLSFIAVLSLALFYSPIIQMVFAKGQDTPKVYGVLSLPALLLRYW